MVGLHWGYRDALCRRFEPEVLDGLPAAVSKLWFSGPVNFVAVVAYVGGRRRQYLQRHTAKSWRAPGRSRRPTRMPHAQPRPAGMVVEALVATITSHRIDRPVTCFFT